MINFIIKKKYVCYITEYLFASINDENYYLIESLRELLKNSLSDLEENVTVSMKPRNVLNLFVGLGNRPEYLTSRIHREIKQIVVAELTIQHAVIQAKIEAEETLTEDDMEILSLLEHLQKREEEIDRYENTKIQIGFEKLTK